MHIWHNYSAETSTANHLIFQNSISTPQNFCFKYTTFFVCHSTKVFAPGTFVCLCCFFFRKCDNYRFQCSRCFIFKFHIYCWFRLLSKAWVHREANEKKTTINWNQQNETGIIISKCNYNDFDSFASRSFQHFDHYFVIMPLLTLVDLGQFKTKRSNLNRVWNVYFLFFFYFSLSVSRTKSFKWVL